jgi:hypothetical protein
VSSIVLSEKIQTGIEVFPYFCVRISVNSIAYGVGIRYMDLGGQRLFHKAYMFAEFPSSLLSNHVVVDVTVGIMDVEIWKQEIFRICKNK